LFSFSAIPFDSEDEPQSMCDFRGDVLLIVNTAALCGFTPQYAGLQAVQDTYADQRVRVLGFLSNDFGNQGGSKGQVEECETTYGLTFQQFEHVGVTSGSADGQHGIFAWLTSQAGLEGEVPWNFSKFLVAADGVLLQRWDHSTPPNDSSILEAIDAALEPTP
jgi:glutathione peroxidase